jgi:hypothetical protein
VSLGLGLPEAPGRCTAGRDCTNRPARWWSEPPPVRRPPPAELVKSEAGFWMALLVLAPLLLLGAASAQLPTQRLNSVIPSRVAVEGGTRVIITGSGFGAPSDTAKCRIGPPPGAGSTVVQASGYLPDANAVLTFPAIVHNDTSASCTLPAVVVGGAVALAISPNGANWATPFWFDMALELTYIELIDVAVGRRPYITESAGSLLVYTDHSLAGTPLSIIASLPCAAHTWSWQLTPTADGAPVAELPMGGLSALPATVNSELLVQITASTGLNISKARRFMRAPPTSGSSAVQPAAVDHRRRAIAVAGEPFLGTGWMMDGHRPLYLKDLTRVTAEVQRIAASGVNQASVPQWTSYMQLYMYNNVGPV